MDFQSNPGGAGPLARIPDLSGLWDAYVPDDGKTERAKKVKFVSCDASSGEPLAKCLGSKGEIYDVSLQACSCVDFSRNKRLVPCKHMVALAMRCRALNEEGLTWHQDNVKIAYELAVKVAVSSTFYHTFHMPVVTDAQYDALKYELWDFCGFVDEESVTYSDLPDDQRKKLIAEPLEDFMRRVMRVVDAHISSD